MNTFQNEIQNTNYKSFGREKLLILIWLDQLSIWNVNVLPVFKRFEGKTLEEIPEMLTRHWKLHTLNTHINITNILITWNHTSNTNKNISCDVKSTSLWAYLIFLNVHIWIVVNKSTTFSQSDNGTNLQICKTGYRVFLTKEI